jgi:VWFA-related protein
MKRISPLMLSVIMALSAVAAQTPSTPQKPPQEISPEDVIRITTSLVQTDAVVTDKNDQIIKDLKLEDFELYDNGKKQDIKFLEFVGVDTPKRVEGTPPALPRGVTAEVPSAGVSAADLRRVIAFVVDDLTIPIEDLARVRDLLLDFVNNQMREGDLVAVVRVVGGNGLLEQFTPDKQLLRNAISRLTAKTHPFAGADPSFASNLTSAAADTALGNTPDEGLNAETQTTDVNKGFRTLMGLATTNAVVTTLRPLPGRKTVVLFSGGLPLFEMNEQGLMVDRSTQETLPIDEIRPLFSDSASLIREVADNASRSGVVVNTMDVRGLQARPGVRGFQDTPAKSGLGMTAGGVSVGGGGMNPTFGRTADMSLISGPDAFAGAQGLRTLANATGGIASINTNNFRAGLDKILARSQGYYLMGYSPSERFDAKFHKISIKVTRDGARVYAREGYFAREDPQPSEQATKENLVVKAALSPLMKSELGVSSLIQHKFLASNKAEVDIHLFIDPKTLQFTQSPEGKHRASFDVVGFVFDLLGKARGGFSETVNANLTPEDYKKALASGLSYSAHTELPPGNFQLRAVVRENETGRIGSTSRYLEVPDLSKRQLTMSSLFLFAIDPNQTGNAGIVPLQALRQLSRKQDLRYAAVVYNPKLSGGQPHLMTQLVVTQGDKLIFREPEQPLSGQVSGIQIIKVGQLGLSRVAVGKYVLTLIVTDTAEKKERRIARSVDFTVIE